MTYPAVLNFDGVTLFQGQPLTPVQQGTYWPGFRVRLISGSTPESTVNPLAQIRDAPVDRGGALLGTMRSTDDGMGWWHFDLLEAVTAVLPPRRLLFDVDLTDAAGLLRTPIVGMLVVVAELSRV